MSIELRQLSAGLGAEIVGVNLSAPIDDATFREIEDAWRKHQILLFRGQKLDHATHIEFSRRFGQLDDHAALPRLRHPEQHEILPVTNQEVLGRKQAVGQQWHSDLSHTLYPARASLLRCEVIPPVGGDTMWSNQYLAYETLSATMKSVVDKLWAVHDITFSKVNEGRRDMDEMRVNTPPVMQPMVRVHPETGRKALYISEMVTSDIVGMRREESQPLLNYLFTHSARPEFCYRHRWQVGDLIAWDNRCTNHLALTDYDMATPRRLFRTTLLGEACGKRLASEEALA
ncbi:TauD/TfdA dioxygenase family protein [Ramlibacter sp.]|uniref:TauD/TfdA dioxygenase family protein n=1 Tax=Ramlibacter sp. TaxID=1917967 RepID=UPI003D0D1595